MAKNKKYRNIKIVIENVSLKKNIEFLSYSGSAYHFNQMIYRKFNDLGFEFYGLLVGGMSSPGTKAQRFYRDLNPKSRKLAVGERIYYGVKKDGDRYPDYFYTLEELTKQKFDVVFFRVINLHANRKAKKLTV